MSYIWVIVMQVIKDHIDQIKEACSVHRVKRLLAFGSVTRNELRADSDIDLVVEIDDRDPFAYTDHYFALKSKLQDLLKRPIDLLEAKAIKNPALQREIDNTKVVVYGE